MSSPLSAESFRNVARKTAWNLMAPFGGAPATTETLVRRPPPPGYAPGDHLVRCVVGPAFIEAENGYVITTRGRLMVEPIEANVPLWERDTLDPNQPRPPPWRLYTPSPLKFRRDRRRGQVRRFQTVVSLRHWWDWNFYHFHLDVLGKLAALDDAGVPFDTPIVIGRYFHQNGWVRDLLSQGRLADRNWVVHDDGLIEANRILYCRARFTYRERAEYIARAAEAPTPTSAATRRVFLNRRNAVSRKVANAQEVARCLDAHGFEEVDAGELTIRAQMELFADTRHLVAVHGAGLTNIIYRQGFPMTVIELYGSGYNSFDFRNLSRDLGYSWVGIEGGLIGDDPQLADVAVDVAELDRQLNTLTS